MWTHFFHSYFVKLTLASVWYLRKKGDYSNNYYYSLNVSFSVIMNETLYVFFLSPPPSSSRFEYDICLCICNNSISFVLLSFQFSQVGAEKVSLYFFGVVFLLLHFFSFIAGVVYGAESINKYKKWGWQSLGRRFETFIFYVFKMCAVLSSLLLTDSNRISRILSVNLILVASKSAFRVSDKSDCLYAFWSNRTR